MLLNQMNKGSMGWVSFSRTTMSDRLKTNYTYICIYKISLGEVYINSLKRHFNYCFVNTEEFDSTLMILILALNHN